MTDTTNRTAAAAPLNEQCKSCFFKGRKKCLCSEEFADPEAAQQTATPSEDTAANKSVIAANSAVNSDGEVGQ